jgi:lambda family phage tail tape measure protein
MGMLARLGVVLGLDSAEFQQGLESADRKLAKFADKIPAMGAAGAAAFTAMTYSAMKFSDELSDVAKANDMTVDSILKLQSALQQSGGEAENAGKMLSSFTNFVDKAASGNQDAQDTFAKIGISLKDLATLSSQDLFSKTADGIAKMQDPLTRYAKGLEVFGKSAKNVDLTNLNEELKNGNNLTVEWSKSISDAASAWDMLSKKHHEFETQFAAGIGSTLKMTVEYLDQIFGKSDTTFNAVKTVMQTLVVVGSDVAFVFKGIASDMTHAVDVAKVLAKEGLDAARKLNQEYSQRMDLERQRLDFFQSRVMGAGVRNPDDPRRLDRAVPQTGPVRKVDLSSQAEKLAQMVKMAELISKEYKRHLDFNLANLKTQGEMAAMTDNERKIQEAVNKVADDTDKKLDEIQKKREEAAAHSTSKNKMNAVIAELDRQAEKVKELGKEYEELSRKEVQSQIAAQSTFEFGWNKAFNQYVEDMENSAKQAQAIFSSLTGNMESAINNFVKTGKLSFNDLAKSIIQDLIAIQLKAQASSIFSSMLPSLFGSKYTPGSDSFVGPLPARANGGYVNSNTAYMVGERGPELFIPQGSGSIIPNNRLQSGSGNQTVNNFTINAIDTKSFEERLYSSSTAVWAANQYANKSLAAVGGRS